ncbi:hypothetical protein PSACC_01035 [Paramicrosporidium saccamoebae]|uniref:Uncharacterized protein n=1 Tax=Paramicrosporidium saccamoebae TaxID=1246581 RepID=A0A2H9TN65_9FUNG|nr:hypothetical protein PSACC_01035 [Paramicrosporidium saccamoebae]
MVTFDEIFDTVGLEKCLLTTYVLDEEWLFPKLKEVPNVILCYDDGKRHAQALVSKRGKLTCVMPSFPKFPSYGVMHCKLMLLFYADFLRVMVFIQDLPRAEPQVGVFEFKDDLCRLLRSLGITETLISNEELSVYDWSKVTARMVYSVPGMINVSHASGLVMLSERVPTAEKLDWIESQGSSLGAMPETWLDDVMACCAGRRPGNSRKRPSEDAALNIKVVFPTTAYALNSNLGPGAFGTIFCQSKNWNSPNYPRALFHKCLSTSADYRPLHTKILSTPNWTYIGSSNFTPSAWGKFVKEKSALMIANYELGVIVEGADFPFPYRRPVSPYEKDDVPWMQELLR